MFCKVFKDEYKKKYTIALARLEKQKNDEKYLSFQELNKTLSKTWKGVSSIDDILDFNLGAIKFKDFEWELIQNSKFKDFFSEKYNDNSYKYLTESDDGIILRGCECYYYIASFKDKSQPVNKLFIIKWIKNLKSFFNKAERCIQNTIPLNTVNKKFILAILDHVRLTATILSTFNLISKSKNQMQIEIFESISKLNKIDSINILDNSINQYLSLLLKGKLYKNDLIKIIDETITLLDKSIVKISHLKDDTVLIRSFKIHREIDCLVENYIAIKNAYNKLCVSMVDFKDKKHFLVCIMNGAIELPLILKMFIPNNIKGFGFFIDNRSYIERHCNPQATIKGHCLFNSDNLIILDDNIMTGKSIDNLIRFLGVTANYNAILVRHPNINRINQIRENGFCINMDELNKKAYGMTFDSPYTKIKPNTNYGNEYLDELGIFTLTGDLFLKLLYKNGHFLPNTEVSTIKGVLNDK